MPGAAKEQTDQVGESEQFKTSSTNCKRPKKFKSLGTTIVGNSLNKDGTEGSKRRKGPHKSKSSKQMFLSRCQDEDTQLVSTNGNGENGKGNRRRRSRKQKRSRNSVDLDEPSRLKKRTRYLLIRMKVEQNLLDAYSTEGWKGQSREKIRPERELQRAEKQILKCKLGLRDAIHQLDLLGSVGCMEDSAIAPDGSVHHEHIHCAKCKLREAFPDNDIILCDGTCKCAFHQKCIDPPLLTENIPPGDQGWFCKFCECKMDLLETINAHLGTDFSEDSMWQDVFKEEAALPDGGHTSLHPEPDWPSDDSEDDDYDPEGNEQCENSCDHIRGGSDANADASDDASSSSSLWSLEEETFSETKRSKRASPDLHISSSYETSDNEVVSGRRQRRAVDYQKLYDEMFGKDAPASEQISEDEDWGPTKRKRREKESADAATTLMTLCETDEKCADENANEVTECSNRESTRRSLFRIPAPAVEKLRLAFAENELPSRAVKEKLSKQLGLDPEKVSKWFKNARYLALKTRKGVCGNPTDTVSPVISKEPESLVEKEKTADQMMGKDISPVNLVDSPKKIMFRRRKRMQSVAGASKEQKHERASISSPADDNEAKKALGDDGSLKLMRKKKAKKEKTKVVCEENDVIVRVQETEPEVLDEKTIKAEAAMVTICRALDKLDRMKKVLLGLPCFQNESTSKEQCVMYVPVAEVKEKA